MESERVMGRMEATPAWSPVCIHEGRRGAFGGAWGRAGPNLGVKDPSGLCWEMPLAPKALLPSFPRRAPRGAERWRKSLALLCTFS